MRNMLKEFIQRVFAMVLICYFNDLGLCQSYVPDGIVVPIGKTLSAILKKYYFKMRDVNITL